MKMGTRSLFFGLHQFLLHPLLMVIAFMKLYRRLPSLTEAVCIVVHDWGYFGCDGIDSRGGEYHPYLGARIARRLFGQKGWEFCIGHNDDTASVECLPRSILYAVDKYYYVLIPVWLHDFLGRLSGEYKEIEARCSTVWDPRSYKMQMVCRFKSGEIVLECRRDS